MQDDIVRRVITVIAGVQGADARDITVDSTFEELEIDSLEALEIVIEVENEFGIKIPDEEIPLLQSVRATAERIAQHLAVEPEATADPQS